MAQPKTKTADSTPFGCLDNKAVRSSKYTDQRGFIAGYKASPPKALATPVDEPSLTTQPDHSLPQRAVNPVGTDDTSHPRDSSVHSTGVENPVAPNHGLSKPSHLANDDAESYAHASAPIDARTLGGHPLAGHACASSTSPTADWAHNGNPTHDNHPVVRRWSRHKQRKYLPHKRLSEHFVDAKNDAELHVHAPAPLSDAGHACTCSGTLNAATNRTDVPRHHGHPTTRRWPRESDHNCPQLYGYGVPDLNSMPTTKFDTLLPEFCAPLIH